MAVPKVSVEIEYAPQENNISSVNFGSTFDRVSGVQDASYPNTLANVSNGSNPFVLGKSILGAGAVYMSEYDGYYSNVMSGTEYYDASDVNKGFKIGENGLTITISRDDGQPITQLSFFFDTVVKQYPVVININGTQYINNSSNFIWVNSAYSSSTITVTFLSWNTWQSPVRITGITDGLTIQYNRASGLLELNIGSQTTSSEDPSFGCISQTSSILLSDDNYQIYYFSTYGLIKEDLPVRVYINGVKVAEYNISSDWRINDKQVSINLYDEIYKWSEYTIIIEQEMFAISLWNFLVRILQQVGYSASNIYCTDETKTYLQSITIDTYVYTRINNLRELLDKLCLVGQFNIYKKLDFGDGKVIGISRL